MSVESGEQLLTRGRLTEALAAFREELAAAPEDGRLLHRLTDSLAMAGHLAEAAALQGEQFDRYLAAGRPREACVLFARLQWLRPQAAARWRAYAEALETLEQASEAEKAYRQCAAALRRERRPAEEIEAWRAVFRLHPADYSTCLEIAARAEACGDPGLAAQAYGQAAALLHEELPLLSRALALAPEDAGLRLRHTRALLAAGKGQEALAELEAMPAGSAGAGRAAAADVAGLRADAYIAAGQPEEAIALILPHLTRADWFERGLRCLHALARLASPRAAEFAAAIEDKAGLEKRHLQWVRELHSLRGEVREPELLEFMADAFNRAGEEPAMLWTLHQSLQLALQDNRLDRAADMLERIVATDPNDPAPGERLAELQGRIPAARWERLKAAVEHAQPPAAAPRRGAAGGAAARAAHAAGQAASHAASKVTRALQRPEKRPPPPSYPQALSISQITPVIRALARETTPRRIFFSAVNHFGRVWSADRCLAANFHSGQDPVNVVEFCAPGVPSRYAAETTKLLNWIEGQFTPPDAKAVIIEAKGAPEEIAPVLAEQGVVSLLAQPLNEAGSVIGAVVLESCTAARAWTGHDLQILEALAEQLVLVLGHARLRGLLQQFTAVDERTGLLKVSSMLEILVAECARAQQQGSTVSVLCLDARPAGRTALPVAQAHDWMLTVTERMGAYLRPHDVLTRRSATEFVLVLPDTIVGNCRAVFRKLAGVLQDQPAPDGAPLALAAGAAEIAAEFGLQAEDIATDVLDRALRALTAQRRQPPAMPPAAAEFEVPVLAPAALSA